ncbi:hypothetical protein [Streptomyces zagrosensis]|uniref:Uncharacterized protein n=1 Tax=Streptomyces zagrosensis TaxID=1042984 RepID=A0A7W9UXL5_9ACTN|nr:hypothetical protein [Streptomyces zagrosensis]MBB5934995.1 hypothetical protein [Streptomyces zagrosensis]
MFTPTFVVGAGLLGSAGLLESARLMERVRGRMGAAGAGFRIPHLSAAASPERPCTPQRPYAPQAPVRAPSGMVRWALFRAVGLALGPGRAQSDLRGMQ